MNIGKRLVGIKKRSRGSRRVTRDGNGADVINMHYIYFYFV